MRPAQAIRAGQEARPSAPSAPGLARPDQPVCFAILEREPVRQQAGTSEFKRSARERRKVEMLFAHLKRNLGLRRLRLRGPTGASDEVLLAATAQNLRRPARNLAATPPTGALAPA